MVRCEICESEVSGGSAFTCSYCGKTFCPSHRLPFNHACKNIEKWRSSSPEKKRSVRNQGKSESPVRLISEILRVRRTWIISAVIIIISVLLIFFTVR